MKRLGEKLRILRQQHNLTVRQLGDILKVNNSYITQIETGRKTPSLKLAIKMADFFDIDVNRLIRDELELDE
jgi:putative transcriptional regulator